VVHGHDLLLGARCAGAAGGSTITRLAVALVERNALCVLTGHLAAAGAVHAEQYGDVWCREALDLRKLYC
jgi:hypothetical protein